MTIKQCPKLSIVVPVYNVEAYLPKCLDSLAAQKDHALEIILSDDGSTDSSGRLCDEFAKANTSLNIRVIHQPNGGLSAARNRGIEIASGEYITFLDSDDYLSADFSDRMLACAEMHSADIVVCAFWKDRDGKLRMNPLSDAVFSSQEALRKLCANAELKNFAWGKLYRRELFDAIRFPEGRLFEDIPTTYKVFCRANKVVCINTPLYYYRTRPDGISGSGRKLFRSACHRCLSYIDRYLDLSGQMPGLIPLMLPDLMYSAGLVSQCYEATECELVAIIEDFAKRLMSGDVPGREQLDFIQRLQLDRLAKKGVASKGAVLLHHLHRVWNKIYLKYKIKR